MMKLRDKILYMTYGAGLVVLGMVLNSFLVDDAEAQGAGLGDMRFRNITCETLIIKDGDKKRGAFGLASGNAQLRIFGDDEQSTVAYLGVNTTENGEMILHLTSKSKTDKRDVAMYINENGGRFDGRNKMGEQVIRFGVHSDGGGGLDMRDKHGYTK